MIIDSYSLQINFTTILLSTSIFVGPPEPPRTASESDGKAKFGAMHSILLRSIFKTVIWVQTFFRSKNTFVTSSTATTFLFSLKVLVKALFLVFLKALRENWLAWEPVAAARPYNLLNEKSTPV